MMAKSANNQTPPASRPRSLDEVPERVRQIAMMRGLGYSHREIAGPFSSTPQAVSLMLTRHRRSLKSLRGAMEARQANVIERLAGERLFGTKTWLR
jgi:DNA-directed RNA polymerase specialized sigma24 family protein